MTKYPVGKCQELENFMVRRRGNRKNTENAKFNQRYREANQTHIHTGKTEKQKCTETLRENEGQIITKKQVD